MGARVVFSSVPPNLRARPTLSVTLDSAHARARVPVTLNYLSRGLGWTGRLCHAVRRDEAGKIDVQGWVTLTNNSGTTFANASTLLVAGAVGGNANDRGSATSHGSPTATREPAGTETAKREQLGDFIVYPLAERTTIANAQTEAGQLPRRDGRAGSQGLFLSATTGSASSTTAAASTTVLQILHLARVAGWAMRCRPVRSASICATRAAHPQFIGESAIDAHADGIAAWRSRPARRST